MHLPSKYLAASRRAPGAREPNPLFLGPPGSPCHLARLARAHPIGQSAAAVFVSLSWGVGVGRHPLLGPPRPPQPSLSLQVLLFVTVLRMRSAAFSGPNRFLPPTHGDRHARLVWSVAVSARTAKELKKQATVAAWLNQPSCRHLGAACSP